MINIILLFLALIPAQASERILPPSVLLKEGYERVPYIRPTEAAPLPPPHSLSWPVEFQDAAHSVANSMAQFQPFGRPYFHGGCDLSVRANAALRSPIAGRLEAGHYSYSTRADGSLEKFWKPWPADGDDLYFEVAVVAESGIRFEFHHVDRDSLPAEIVQKLQSRDPRVGAGDLLGNTIYWPGNDYHHIHYNVIDPSGVRINPEFVSPLVPDATPPELRGAYAETPSGNVDFGNGKFSAAPSSFVLALLDRYDHSVYEHPVVLARLQFASGEKTEWDFRQTLTNSQGVFPSLWDYFVESFRTPNGRRIYTEGGYGTGQSVIRLKVPAGARGAFTIEVEDMSGNRRTLTGEI